MDEHCHCIFVLTQTEFDFMEIYFRLKETTLKKHPHKYENKQFDYIHLLFSFLAFLLLFRIIS